VSQNQPVSEAETKTPVRTQPVDPLKNPSYPQRAHIHERAKWEAVLKNCEDQVGAARRKLAVLGNRPNRARLERLYVQMLGARDQVADAARRLPGETGDLYEEDHHRLEEAVVALDRVQRLWKEEEARTN
jgi:hypothetical protein